MTCVKSLDGADENTVTATKCTLQELVFRRMDWSKLDNDSQQQNFRNFVSHAVGLLCDAVPEHILAVTVLSVNGVPVSGLKNGDTIQVNFGKPTEKLGRKA